MPVQVSTVAPLPSPTATATPAPSPTPAPTFTPRPTSTPAPTRTPTPTPIPLSKLLYQDNFENPESGWLNFVGDDSEHGHVNGEYRILVKNTGSGSWVQGIPSFTDFDVRVQARNELAQAGNYGLLFRFQDQDNFYVFWVNPASGNYRVTKLVSGEFSSLIAWRNSPLIPPGYGPIVLRVVARGSMFQFYVDDDLVASHQDASIRSGRVGLWAENEVATNGAEIFFDDLKVYGAESEIVPTATPAPTPIPTLVSIPLPPGTTELLYRDDFTGMTSPG